jgi:hypothetical protein
MAQPHTAEPGDCSRGQAVAVQVRKFRWPGGICPWRRGTPSAFEGQNRDQQSQTGPGQQSRRDHCHDDGARGEEQVSCPRALSCSTAQVYGLGPGTSTARPRGKALEAVNLRA